MLNSCGDLIVAAIKSSALENRVVPQIIYLESIMKKLNLSICEICHISFTVNPGCNGRCCSLVCSNIWCSNNNREVAQEKMKRRVKKYNSNPAICKSCGAIFSYDQRKKSFCNRSCSATFNNKLRQPISLETKIKRSKSVKKFYEHRKSNRSSMDINQKVNEICNKRLTGEKLPTVECMGLYTKVYQNICKKTGIVFFSKTYKKYHPTVYKDRDHYKLLCRFDFSIKEYSSWFAYANKIIKEHGWYSPYNKKNNLTGCSRDHLYSISDGYKNNIDPKIISHPANCHIVTHTENQKKHKNSSITLEELMERIKLFDEKYKKME
jgi:hypothetical protein